MKFIQLKNLNWVLSALIAFGFASCKKMNSQGFTPGTGAPVITSVRTLSQSVVDSSRTSSVTTYNSTGIATTVTNADYNPEITAFDSTTTTGKLNNYYVLQGSNLGSTTKIAVNGVSIYFNRALSSDSHVVFQIPTTVPYVQPQANAIVVTTLYGTVSYKFTTLPPPPTIVTESTNDFQAGGTITLTGKGFASVSSITLRATSDAVSIALQNDSTLVLTMPKSTATQSTLLFTYTSGSNPSAQTASTAVFNDLDNAAYIVFTDNYGAGVSGQAWGTFGTTTTAANVKTGTTSYYVIYPNGNYWIGGWNFSPPVANKYTYLSLWIKGGFQNETLDFISAQGSGGYGNSDQTFTLALPANVWTYFKIPVASTDMFLNGQTTGNFGFYIRGPNGGDETIYFDDVVFWK
jgi:hypothetical protein